MTDRTIDDTTTFTRDHDQRFYAALIEMTVQRIEQIVTEAQR